MRSDQAELAVSRLINQLMHGMSLSRESDDDLRLMAAECIGKIGAVDPGKLKLSASVQGICLLESNL